MGERRSGVGWFEVQTCRHPVRIVQQGLQGSLEVLGEDRDVERFDPSVQCQLSVCYSTWSIVGCPSLTQSASRCMPFLLRH